MSCKQCEATFTLEAVPAKIFFVSQFEELVTKSKIFFMNQGYDLHKLHDLHYIQVDNCKEFFTSNFAQLENNFNTLEQRKIKIYIESLDVGFQYQSLLNAKTLDNYLNLLRDKDFFDIINNETLTSYFQPIVEAHTKRIYGYEALIRGVHPDGTLMYPDELFSKSARNDMNFRLDKLCRESALKTSAVKNIHQKVFINFLPTAIYDPKFCLQSTIKWANQLEFDPKNIVFEVVESESVEDKKHLKTILNYYREQGYQIALDDVGEGYSTLNMLIDLQPDILKVDRKIITNIHQDSLKQSIYKALWHIAQDSGIKLLAEGVETKEELEAVSALGVDYLQGYYFSKPQAEPIRKIQY